MSRGASHVRMVTRYLPGVFCGPKTSRAHTALTAKPPLPLSHVAAKEKQSARPRLVKLLSR